MSDNAPAHRTRVLLSFCRAHVDLARRLAYDLRAAGIEVRLDQWDGGGGAAAIQCAPMVVDDVKFVLPLITPSDGSRAWMGEEWKRAIFDQAQRGDIAVLPVRGRRCEAVPDFIEGRSFADLANRGYEPELRRLVATIRRRTGDAGIEVPPAKARSLGGRSPAALAARPIVVQIGKALAPLFAGGVEASSSFDHLDRSIRDGMYFELGVHFPKLALRTATDAPPTLARIVINDVEEARIDLPPDSVMVSERFDSLAARGFDAKPQVNPANGGPASWIPASQAGAADADGLTVWNTREVLELLLAAVVRRNAAQFIGMNEVQAMLEQLVPFFPTLVAETIPATVSLFTLTEVLRRLVAEEVCIRNLRRILMALAESGRREQDPMRLTEVARGAQRREITHRLGRGTGQVVVLWLDEDIERSIRDATRHAPTGSFLELEPGHARAILDAVRVPLRMLKALPFAVMMPSILTRQDIRSSVRRLVAPSVPWMGVVSYADLTPQADIRAAGLISLAGFRPRDVAVDGMPLWG